jgi:hypothetical protein
MRCLVILGFVGAAAVATTVGHRPLGAQGHRRQVLGGMMRCGNVSFDADQKKADPAAVSTERRCRLQRSSVFK